MGQDDGGTQASAPGGHSVAGSAGPAGAGLAAAKGHLTRPQARVRGRVGEVDKHDPSDDFLTFKIVFPDGVSDWFPRKDVELLSCDENALATLKVTTPAPQAQLGGDRAADGDGGDGDEIQDWGGRVKGTPVQDESFICMGSRAPICPRPAEKQSSGSVMLETVQGSWRGSGGVQIVVVGTCVHMNGLPLTAHPVTLSDDGEVLSIGSLWQLYGWSKDMEGGLDFRCTSTRDPEQMESSKSEIWTRQDVTSAAEEADRLRLMGYAGSSANPLSRGVEGCMPGTMGIELGTDQQAAKDAKDIALLSALVSQWRESDETLKVHSWRVIPDSTNRAQTGLGVELVHFVASSMRDKGFCKRRGAEGHDIPVLVREPPGDLLHEEALRLWRERTSEEEGFPPIRVKDDEEIFTSLGNGHFFQALNCFACELEAINEPGRRYVIGQDALLAEAIADGVPSIVLRHGTPRPVRAKIAEFLNSKRDFGWTLGEDGTVDVAIMDEKTGYCSQFEWLSKGMDAAQVNCLVRQHLGIRNSKRIEG